MQRLSATEAVSPAFRRTHALLFRPFHWGRSWKLAATANLAFAGSVFLPVPLLLFLVPWHRVPGPWLRLAVGAAVLVYSTIVFVFFYLGSRLEMVEFEWTLTGQPLIRPMWRHFGGRVWPWIGLKAAVSTALTLPLLPLFLHLGRSLFRFASALPASDATGASSAPSDVVFSLVERVFGLYALLLGSFLLLKFCSTLLSDFVLPFLLLDEASVRVAVRSGWATVRAEPFAVLWYLVLKFGLASLGFVALSLANNLLMIPFVLVFAVVGGIGGALFGPGLLHHAGGATGGFAVVGLLFFVFLGFLLYFQLGAFGYVVAVLRSYNLLFLGGRYPRLGDLLEPPPAPFPPPLPAPTLHS